MEPRAVPEIAGAGFRPATLALAEGELPYLIGGSGPLVVLSYTMGPLAWGSLVRLAAHCTVVVLDWPAAPLDFGVAASHYWLTPLTESLGFVRGALCTWSLGAPWALRYAACRPAVLSHLILVDPAGLRADFRGGIWPDQPTPEQVREMVAGMWRFWVRNPAVDTGALQELHIRTLLQPAGYEGNRRANIGAAHRPLLGILPLVQVPTLLLTGQHSGVFGPETGAAATSWLPRARLVTCEESSHAVPLEEPERFQDEVAAFLLTDDGSEEPV